MLVDANILIYAEDSTSRFHGRAIKWWDGQLSGSTPVLLCWPVITAFMRIVTNPRIYQHPRSLAEATGRVQSWLGQPNVRIASPGEEHWEVFRALCVQAHVSANLVADAHIAAIAIEHACELCSADSDFSRFKGLRWRNPLA